jgi:hypothetical protein
MASPTEKCSEILQSDDEISATFVERASLMIAAAPANRRERAFELIERRFNGVFREVLGDTEMNKEKLRRQLRAIKALVDTRGKIESNE